MKVIKSLSITLACVLSMNAFAANNSENTGAQFSLPVTLQFNAPASVQTELENDLFAKVEIDCTQARWYSGDIPVLGSAYSTLTYNSCPNGGNNGKLHLVMNTYDETPDNLVLVTDQSMVLPSAMVTQPDPARGPLCNQTLSQVNKSDSLVYRIGFSAEPYYHVNQSQDSTGELAGYYIYCQVE